MRGRTSIIPCRIDTSRLSRCDHLAGASRTVVTSRTWVLSPSGRTAHIPSTGAAVVLDTDSTRGSAPSARLVGRLARGRRTGEKGGIGAVICGDCGETNKPGTEFCMFCGAYLGWQEGENRDESNDVTERLPTQPPAPVSTPAEARPTRSTGATRAEAPASPTPAGATTSGRARTGARPTAPTPADTESARPTHQPTPVEASVSAPPEARPAEPLVPSSCPTCGRAVEGARRFCGHCGEQFIRPGTNAPITRPTKKRDTWWSRLWDSKDRVARRAYRRSLPPLYRWRRVIIAVLALGLIGGGLTVVGGSPRAFVLARYHDVRKTLVTVPGVTAQIIPPEASAPDTTPAALVDGTAKAWQMEWTSSTRGSRCGVTPTTAVIQLSFARTRIREIDMRAGLLANNPNRPMQFRPQQIWIAYADQCVERSLDNVERQKVLLDTEFPVDSLRIGVITALPPDQPAGAQQVLSFTEITLHSRPPAR